MADRVPDTTTETLAKLKALHVPYECNNAHCSSSTRGLHCYAGCEEQFGPDRWPCPTRVLLSELETQLALVRSEVLREAAEAIKAANKEAEKVPADRTSAADWTRGFIQGNAPRIRT